MINKVKSILGGYVERKEHNLLTGDDVYSLISELGGNAIRTVVAPFIQVTSNGEKSKLARVTVYNLMNSNCVFDCTSDYMDVLDNLKKFVNTYNYFNMNRRAVYACRGIKR